MLKIYLKTSLEKNNMLITEKNYTALHLLEKKRKAPITTLFWISSDDKVNVGASLCDISSSNILPLILSIQEKSEFKQWLFLDDQTQTLKNGNK